MESVRDPEVWRDVPGFEGVYQVSSWGHIKSLAISKKYGNGILGGRREKILKGEITRRGYRRVTLTNSNSIVIRYQVHQIVAKVFVLNPFGYTTVNHIDHDPLNNYFLNLEWVNVRENQTHRWQSSKKSSQFTGVSYVTTGSRKKRWRAKIVIDGVVHNLGTFETENEAGDAYLKELDRRSILNKYAAETPQ